MAMTLVGDTCVPAAHPPLAHPPRPRRRVAGVPMNVSPIPTLDERINDIRMRTAGIVNEHILPNENQLWHLRRSDTATEADHRQARELREDIKQVVKKEGLWAPHLPTEYGGMGL